MQRELDGRIIKNRKIEIRSIGENEKEFNCSLIYIEQETDEDCFRKLYQNLKHKPALTVSEMQNFMQLGGELRLFEENNNLRFEVNMPELQTSGITIDASLLRLGKVYPVGYKANH